jgi:hypothetical protein
LRLDLSATGIATSIDPKLFSKTYPFAGVMEGQGVRSPTMSMEVRVSDVNAHPPTGVILGNIEDYRRLEAFFIARRGECSVRSISVADHREEFQSDGVMLRRIGAPHWPADEASYIYQPIGFFELDDLTISRKFVPPLETRRRVVFHHLNAESAQRPCARCTRTEHSSNDKGVSAG